MLYYLVAAADTAGVPAGAYDIRGPALTPPMARPTLRLVEVIPRPIAGAIRPVWIR